MSGPDMNRLIAVMAAVVVASLPLWPIIAVLLAGCTDYYGAFHETHGVKAAEQAKAAQSATQPRWQETDQPNCQTWDPRPAPDTHISWSGACAGGKVSGRGRMIWTYRTETGKMETAVQDADFLDGYAEGQGTYWVAGGFNYEGGWQKSEMDGYGVLLFENGDRYEGGWKHGKMNGTGVMIFADGESYVGELRDGKKEGTGKSTLADGSSYEGPFYNNQRDGIGVCHEAAGRTGTCRYNAGKFGGWL